MTMPLHEIESEALQLPAHERGRLVERLLRSLEHEADGTPEEVAQAWEAEIGRRIDDLDAGRAEAIPYEQVRAQLRAMIDAARRR